MGKLSIQFAPVEDAGTGEVDHALGPVTYEADDITNTPTGEAEHVNGETHKADAVAVESTGGTEAGPVTTVADWPPHGEDKAVTNGEAKAAPAKKAPAKAAAKKGA